jgi:hypothetical protein
MYGTVSYHKGEFGIMGSMDTAEVRLLSALHGIRARSRSGLGRCAKRVLALA